MTRRFRFHDAPMPLSRTRTLLNDPPLYRQRRDDEDEEEKKEPAGFYNPSRDRRGTAGHDPRLVAMNKAARDFWRTRK